ncbi:MAG: hypothetical protein HY512_02800 [Candidatus Aenigmarchaeota archaeon]|nr:hypothetical protein [Candidatus Aenigmarchaeota archaeon]
MPTTELMTIGIPFFFILAVVFGSLEFSGVFKNKGVKFIIAAAIAFFGVSNATFIETINLYMPYAAVFFIILFFIGYVAKFFKVEKGQQRDWVLMIIVVGLLLILLVSMQGNFEQYFKNLPINYENFLIIVAIILFIVALFAAYKHGRA